MFAVVVVAGRGERRCRCSRWRCSLSLERSDCCALRDNGKLLGALRFPLSVRNEEVTLHTRHFLFVILLHAERRVRCDVQVVNADRVSTNRVLGMLLARKLLLERELLDIVLDRHVLTARADVVTHRNLRVRADGVYGDLSRGHVEQDVSDTISQSTATIRTRRASA